VKCEVVLCVQYIPDTAYQFLSKSLKYCRGYDKKFLVLFTLRTHAFIIEAKGHGKNLFGSMKRISVFAYHCKVD